MGSKAAPLGAPPSSPGNFTRPAVAKSNMLVNARNETKYFYQDLDLAGARLNGANRYTVTFPQDQAPPVNGFWSLPLYDQSHFFAPNQIKRFSLGTKNKDLKVKPDGSLTVYVQSDPPAETQRANWLPAPKGANFSLFMRAYWPKVAVTDGSWTAPPVQRTIEIGARGNLMTKTKIGAQMRPIATALLAAVAVTSTPSVRRADEGGISVWLPGLFGSLAAVPAQPGWSFATLYVHPSVSANGKKDFPLNGRIVAGLKGSGNLTGFGPTYIFETPILGGQAALSVLGIAGQNIASIAATLSGPRGNTLSGTLTDSRSGFGDVFPQASLKWNLGVNNLMTYLTGAIPVGAYDASRLANLGLEHGAADGGGGYTYFDPQTGHEFSAVTGLTYNFTNHALDY